MNDSGFIVSQPGTLRIRFSSRQRVASWRVFDFDLVTGENVVASDVYLVAIHADVTMIDELAGSGAALGEAEEVHGGVETGLEELQEALAGDAALLLGDLEDATELTLEQAVDVAELLLFVQADGIFRDLAAKLRTVLSGRIAASFESFAGAEKMLTETTADASGGAGITSHGGWESEI